MVRERAPAWFRIVAVILLLWGLLGCYSCLQQLRLGADAMGQASAYDRALYAALPGWYDPCFVVAVLSGTIGAAALLARSRWAIPLAVAALVTVIVMFGYMFISTDIIAHKGIAEAAGFPAFIFVVAVVQLWLSRKAVTRGWIG